jgi:hypothetical protein
MYTAICMVMTVGMNKTSATKQGRIEKNVTRSASSDNAAISQDVTLIGDVFHAGRSLRVSHDPAK